jgi:hypothetical protein
MSGNAMALPEGCFLDLEFINAFFSFISERAILVLWRNLSSAYISEPEWTFDLRDTLLPSSILSK